MKDRAADLIGSSIGHIRIIDVLGEGGMGTVYLGRDEKLRRKVAVKAIHDERRLHEHAKARFLQEARMLSQLNHPKICAVHEFIENDDSDFLVLEFVEGRNLRAAIKTQLSHQQKMDIARQLLEVLVAVHGAGVIHRDLKPENIMVRPDGTIAVLDFGLARSVDDDGARFPGRPTLDLQALDSIQPTKEIAKPALSVQVATNQGTVVGTAGYMSPEQARAESATAASDMYTLGLIFQELFTGSPPFERKSSSVELVLKTAVGESLPVAGLPTDLKALIERLKSFAPGARPSSVDALDQLQRIIDRPKRQRKRIIVAVIWLTLALLAVGMTIQTMRASREADRANREAEAAHNVSDFLVNLFEESNPERTRGASLSAEEILRRGAENINDGLGEQPLTRAKLLMTIGRVYNKIGLYAESVSLVEEALEIRERELGEDDPEVVMTLFLLGSYKGDNGDFGGALSDLENALTVQERLFGPNHIEVTRTLTNLASNYTKVGDLEKAKAMTQRALVILEEELGPEHSSVAMNLGNLGILAAIQGRPEDAGPLFQQALAILEPKLGGDHPRVLRLRTNLATNLMERGRLNEAEPLYRQNAETIERVLGSDHPDLGKTYQNYANLLVLLERPAEAESLYLQSLEIARTSLGPVHPEVGLCLSNLGELYLAQGRLEEAEATCLEALSIRVDTLGPNHPRVAPTLIILARISRELGQVDEANERYEQSVAILEAAFATDHPQTTEIIEEYAEFLRENDREDEATELEPDKPKP